LSAQLPNLRSQLGLTAGGYAKVFHVSASVAQLCQGGSALDDERLDFVRHAKPLNLSGGPCRHGPGEGGK